MTMSPKEQIFLSEYVEKFIHCYIIEDLSLLLLAYVKVDADYLNHD